ncbi:MAG: hypothetical protein DHS20C06_14460 [Hyphobacterium sp.]|nr:MAG: hypothetical protein DHS20C06_14460 [Hyphobacterium sp.]
MLRTGIQTLLGVFAIFAIVGDSAWSQDDIAQRSPLEMHLAHMLEGSGQWRTPNEDMDPDDPNGFESFGADFRLSDDRSHVIAEITGNTTDGRRAVFWTIYFFYNPVTEDVISAQVSWNGTYLEGRESVDPDGVGYGEIHRSDQIHYNPDGTMSIQRHDIMPLDANTHTTQTYSRGDDGSWQPDNFRTWTLLVEE